MFTLRSICTTAIVLSGVFIQQTAIAYPRASKKSEISYLKSIIQAIYEQSSPQLDNYIETEYKKNSPNIQQMLDEGYKVCDFIQVANKHGISSRMMIAEEISQMNNNNGLQRRGTVLDEKQIASLYDHTMNNLCPELD